ncbi:HAMP domain-containing sensor histidine kinase [Desulfococcaceae bacterium HSG8]|nr:HAMP domain-containing sensor histidine kinase [Desulfococcaceae bacterium HSG8]
MKPGRLYIKILISFALVLIVTEIMIFGLFVVTAGRIFHSRLERFTIAKMLTAKAYVEDKIRAEPRIPFARNQPLADLIRFLGNTHGAKVWLTSREGKHLIKSFDGSIPEDMAGIDPRPISPGQNSGVCWFSDKKHRLNYASVNIDTGQAEDATLHVFFRFKGKDIHHGAFALGLLTIGIVIALLIIPISRRITNPVRHLNASALRIAQGDLSHRADIPGKDEIAELGQSFNRMADKLEQMIRGGRELTANLSHELRSPLARIRIASELLGDHLESLDDELINTRLEDIGEDVEELDHLIGRIMSLSKPDIRQQPLKHDIFDPKQLISELIERFRSPVEVKKLIITSELSDGVSLSGDREEIRTAISNILDNAVKFSPQNGRVSVVMRSENSDIIIRISNTFPALSEADLEKIFEPFYRPRKTEGQGSGLGLAITRKIIERHGGKIKAVNSEDGLCIEIHFDA